MKETAKHQKSQHVAISYCKEKDAMSGECIFTILITETQKRETARPLFFVCDFFVGSLIKLAGHTICLLCAFFVAIAKLLKTNQIQIIVCKIYKTLIYSIIIGWSLGDLSAVCRRSFTVLGTGIRDNVTLIACEKLLLSYSPYCNKI